MRKKTLILMILIVFVTSCWRCSNDSNVEKHQNNRSNVIHVKDKIKEIDLGDILVGQFSKLYIINDYLLISDLRSYDKVIHIFNKDDFSHLASMGDRGQGPNEITSPGFIGTNEKTNEIYVSDHGKQLIYGYHLDSVFKNPQYQPYIKMEMNKTQFPDSYYFINDTLSMGIIVAPTGNSGFDHLTAKINFNTGEIIPTTYKHPAIERKRVTLAVSSKYNIYVECYRYHDLMTICDLDGRLKCNVYGKHWSDKVTNRYGFFEKVIICDDKIVATFSAGNNRYSGTENDYPTQFIVFNMEGDYLKTLETECNILDFCYDEKNNRIIMHLDDNIMQSAYLDLNE